MNATASALLMRNFNEIFMELDPFKCAALLAECFAEDCLWIHPGGRIVSRDGVNAAATEIHYTGTDFLEERDGRVSRLYTFIDQKLLV